jgi:hypothetical protein
MGSPYGGLVGPKHDVEIMAQILERQGFVITTCFGKNATRDSIRTAWRALIDQTSSEDTVVIYYSGHGGLIESPQKIKLGSQVIEPILPETPWRYQFIVPVDFDKTTEKDFRGILDVEISYLLRDMTNKTRNVTTILDCCHAGQMSRHPKHGTEASPKRLKPLRYQNLSDYI